MPKSRKPIDLVSRAISDANQSPAVAARGPSATQSITEENRKLRLDQHASTGDGGTMRGVNQHQEINLADREYYFELALTDSAEKPVPGDAKLHGGEKYTVRVSASLTVYTPMGLKGVDVPLTQNKIRIKRKERLSLFVDGTPVEPSTGNRASEQGIIFDTDADLNRWAVEYTFTLLSPPSSEIVRILLARTTNVNSRAAELVYQREEPVHAAAQLTATYLPAVPPQHTAILHVDADGADHILFKGFLADKVNRPLSLASIERPRLKPEDYKDEGEYLAAIRDKALDVALKNPGNVTDWLQEVIAAYGENCCIVILDKADSEIPWEMFKLSGGRYLGAVAMVVRWTEAQYRTEARMLATDEFSLSGRLAAYVYKDDWQATGQQRPVLTRMAPILMHDPDDLLDELIRKDAGPVGLVYLGYGGILVHGDEHDALARLRAMPKPYESSVRFSYEDVEGNVDPRPLFFVDSAFSGRVLRKGQELCGLAQATLTQVAVGYIGTLGPVDRRYAAKVAERFLEAAEKGVRPAELLRQMRASAAKQLVDTNIPKKVRVADFLHTFMYVYYGNPCALLKVNSSC
jgi:hypothetical protein